MNKTGPMYAVTDAEKRVEDTTTRVFRRLIFTPKLCAYAVPKELPISGFMVLKQSKMLKPTKIAKIKIWFLVAVLFAPKDHSI